MDYVSMFTKKTNTISGILVGDELGQVKRIDIPTEPSEKPVIRTVNKEIIGDQISPDKSVLSIRPFPFCPEPEVPDDDDPDADIRSIRQALSRGVFVIVQKPNKVFLYNSRTDDLAPIDIPASIDNPSPLIGASPVSSTDVVLIFENGGVFLVNVESELNRSCGQNPDKALKVLGVKMDAEMKPKNMADHLTFTKDKDKFKDVPPESPKKKLKKDVSESSKPFNPVVTVCDHKWKKGDKTITCFSVDNKRLVIAGHNLDPIVYDLCTKTCIFSAKGAGKSVVSGITWIGPITKDKTSFPINTLSCKVPPSPVPSLIATCSKTDPLLRIYDIRSKAKKAIWILNLKDVGVNLNNETNPPSFSCISSSPCPTTCAVPTQQLVLGTTMGRMLAIELRWNSHSHRPLGVFKGFSGGTVRDVSFVANVGRIGDHKVISCSLDRFVRIHSFRLGSSAQRKIESKFYTKTRPTCLEPLLWSVIGDKKKDDHEEIEDIHEKSEESDQHDDDDEDLDSDINLDDFAEPEMDSIGKK